MRKRVKHKAAIEDFSVREKSPIVNGMVLDRKPTDVLFCFIFLAFMLAIVGMAAYGFFNGNIQKLVALQDGDHKLCGVDNSLEDYPYLYLTDLTKDDAFELGVCVKECPGKSGNIECHPTQWITGCNSKAVTDNRYPSNNVVGICFPT